MRFTPISKLEAATYICLIAGCVVTVGLQLERRLAPAYSGGQASQGTPLIGKTLEVPGINWQAHTAHTVLFMSTTCHFCLESLPYYRKLGARVPLEVLSPDAIEDVQALFSAEHVATDGVYRLSQAIPDLKATPTLLVTDAKGVVRKAYVGKLGPAQEVEFLKIASSGGNPSM